MNHHVAIAGIDSVAEMHTRLIADIDGAQLVAGSCRTESTGREFAEEFDCEWYADTEQMLDAESVDVLSVCTPSGAHLEPALAAAERGVHVLCEKPLEITTARIDQMIAACDEAGVRLGGIFQQRHNPVVRTVREAVSDGRFGGPLVANAQVPWWRDDDYYAGAWQGTEELDGGGAADPMSIDYSNPRRNIADFLSAVEDDEPYPLDGEEARKAVEIITAIYESADTGQPVRVGD